MYKAHCFLKLQTCILMSTLKTMNYLGLCVGHSSWLRTSNSNKITLCCRVGGLSDKTSQSVFYKRVRGYTYRRLCDNYTGYNLIYFIGGFSTKKYEKRWRVHNWNALQQLTTIWSFVHISDDYVRFVILFEEVSK